MAKNPSPLDETKEEPSRTDQARQIVEDYARDLRKIIEMLRKKLDR